MKRGNSYRYGSENPIYGTEGLTDIYGYSMDVYMTELLAISDLDNIYEECYNEAEEKIKYKLLIGAVAYMEDIRAEGDGFDSYMENVGQGQDITSEEMAQYKVNYLTAQVKEYLLNIARE